MKHHFVINPVAGQRDSYDDIVENLSSCFSNKNDYVVYTTKRPNDAYDYVKKTLETATEDIVFYACGGDGTVYEVVNALSLFDNGKLGVLPVGSCNDFLKSFPNIDFMDIKNVVNGEFIPVDIIKVNDYYCVNVANCGFDARVNDDVCKSKMKHIDVKKAYRRSIIKNILNKKPDNVKVHVDGKLVKDGKTLLMAFANAMYYGGGYKCAPYASVNDGLLEVVIVNNLHILKFASLIKKYKNGEHLDNKKILKYITYLRGTRVTVESDELICFCLDGETVWDKKFEIEILPSKIQMICPKQ